MITNPKHEPPTSDEMLAYMRGELSVDEEARFRDRLIPYPELVRTLTAPFPTEGAEPGDEDYLSDRELTRHWAAMQTRMPRGAVVQFWPSVAAIAATLALVFGALYWQAHTKQGQPRVLTVDGQTLFPDGNQRGSGSDAATVTPHGDWYALVPVLMDERPFDTYRVELFDVSVDPQRSLWSMSGLRRGENATLIVAVPRSFLSPGIYRLTIYGSNGGREELVNHYTIRIPTTAR
jgi:hypothetical protein